ncbi:MAG: hypothetical protein ACI910_001169 [Oleispira sp.]|jgi:hypothetical protein
MTVYSVGYEGVIACRNLLVIAVYAFQPKVKRVSW